MVYLLSNQEDIFVKFLFSPKNKTDKSLSFFSSEIYPDAGREHCIDLTWEGGGERLMKGKMKLILISIFFFSNWSEKIKYFFFLLFMPLFTPYFFFSTTNFILEEITKHPPTEQFFFVFFFHKFPCGVVGNTVGFHPATPGSIPGKGALFFFTFNFVEPLHHTHTTPCVWRWWGRNWSYFLRSLFVLLFSPSKMVYLFVGPENQEKFETFFKNNFESVKSHYHLFLKVDGEGWSSFITNVPPFLERMVWFSKIYSFSFFHSHHHSLFYLFLWTILQELTTKSIFRLSQFPTSTPPPPPPHNLVPGFSLSSRHPSKW